MWGGYKGGSSGRQGRDAHRSVDGAISVRDEDILSGAYKAVIDEQWPVLCRVGVID